MRFCMLVTLVLVSVAVSDPSALAGQPPVFTYYRLTEPNDSSASRTHAIDIGDSAVYIGGETRVETESVASVVISRADSSWPFWWELLPTPDSSVASRVVDIVWDPEPFDKIGAGSWDGGPVGGSLPIVWYDTSAVSSEGFFDTFKLLPTIGGTGTGEARCVCSVQSAYWNPAGWSAPATGIKRAVAWTADSAAGPYTLELMPDYGTTYPSQANDIVHWVEGAYNTSAVGWAVTSEGLTLPQEWKRDSLGTHWLRTPMPLPQGAVEGGVNSLISVGGDAQIAAGWCKDTHDYTQAVCWKKTPRVSPTWIPQVLGTLDGYAESEGMGAGLVGEEGDDIVVVGTSWTAGDSAATLWTCDSTGTVTVYNLNDLIVNEDSLDLSLRIATDVDLGGSDSLVVITGWGVEMGGMSPLSSPADPHAFLLIEEPAAASVNCRNVTPVSLKLATSPNPFSSGVRASYGVGRSMPVRLAVYDVGGRLVKVLTDDLKAAGDHSTTWDGLDSRGHHAGSGIYFLRLEAGGRAVTSKAIFIR
jgi:hypothetical protein